MNIPEPDNIDAGVTSVCISPDGRLVAAGSLDTVVRIWDVATGQLVERLKGHRDSVYSVAFTPDGKALVSGSLDKTLKYWDVRPLLRARDPKAPGAGAGAGSGGLVKEKEMSAPGGPGSGSGSGGGGSGGGGSQCTMNFVGHKDYVLSVAVSHDGKWVVSGSKDRGVQFWDAQTAVAQCMLQGHKNSGECCFCFGRFRVYFCVLFSVFCVLCSVFCVLCSVFCVLCSVFCVLCSVFCVLCSVLLPLPWTRVRASVGEALWLRTQFATWIWIWIRIWIVDDGADRTFPRSDLDRPQPRRQRPRHGQRRLASTNMYVLSLHLRLPLPRFVSSY